jgi:ubiquinone/menaquinone biosynthesis C-methylase UbiE
MTDFIKAYWESQARKHGAAHEASWGDNFAIALEIDTIAKSLRDGDTVLDVGCANGFSAFRQLERHKLKRLVGIDYAASMVEAARAAKTAAGLADQVEFHEGDVRTLGFPDATFDVVYTTRVLINLPTWEEQVQGIGECLRVAKPGGTVILSEGFWEPLMLLNAMRALVRLAPLVEHDFNRYLKKERLEELLASLRLEYRVEDFSSVYYLGSRLLRELVTDPAAYPGYSNPINELFYNIERDYSGGGFGVQQAYVITKPRAKGTGGRGAGR